MEQNEEINKIASLGHVTVSETEEENANNYLINHNFNMNWLNTPVPDSFLSNIDHNIIVSGPRNVTLEGEQGKQVALSGSSWYDVDLNSTSSTQSTVYQSNLSVPPQTTNVVSPTSVTHHLIKKGDTNIPNNGVIKVKHIIIEIIGISLVLVLISTSVSLKTLRNMSNNNETIPVTHDITYKSLGSHEIYPMGKNMSEQSSYKVTDIFHKTSDDVSQFGVKSDNISKLFPLYPFTIRPSKTNYRAPQPTSLQSPNNRPSSPPVSEIT